MASVQRYPPCDSEYPGYLRVLLYLYLIQQDTQSSTSKTSQMGYLVTEVTSFCLLYGRGMRTRSRSTHTLPSAAGGGATQHADAVGYDAITTSYTRNGHEGAAGNTNGYSSTYLAMGFANVRAGTHKRRGVFGYPPEH